MNILFISSHIPRFFVNKNKGRFDSLYRDTESLISGLNNVDNVCLKVITSPDIPRYPKGPLFVKKEYNAEENVTLVGNFNIPILRVPWSVISMVIEASNYLRRIDGPVVVIIPYMFIRHVLALRIIKKIFPQKVIQACIIPDVFFPSGIISKVINRWTEHMAKSFDCYVLFTKHMADYLHISKEKYIVIEGFISLPDKQKKESPRFNVVYTGSLNLKYGVGRLVDSMHFITNNDVELHLYGKGDAVSMIKEAAIKDNRIKYFGLVGKSEAINAIYSAAVLVNPRNSNDGEYTNYSFPSKDIDYLATGVPTLLCKLPGMPQEYYGHFVDIQEGTPEQIADAILKVYRMTPEERNVLGKDSRDFIKDRMDIDKQSEKVVSLFNDILSKKQYLF